MNPRPSRPPVPNVLSPEQAKAVREAKRLLSTPQRETINRRRCAVNANPPLVIQCERRLSNSSKGEGTSRLKGKGINPKEWGDADFFEGEVDLESQHAALESWKAAQAWAHTQSELMRKDVRSLTTSRASRTSVRAPATRVLTLESSSDESDSEPKKTKKTTRHLGKFVPKKDQVVDPTDSLTDRLSCANPVHALVDKAVAQPTKHRERCTTLRAMEPVEQINPKSYIGLALKRLAKGKGPASSSKSSSSTSSISGDSSSDSDSSTSSGSDSDNLSPSLSSSSSSTSGRRRHRRRNRSKGNLRSGRSRCASKKHQKS